LDTALVFTALAAGFAFEALVTGFRVFAAGFGLAAVLAAGFAVFTNLEEAAFLTATDFDFDALLAPVSRVVFFEAAGAFATLSSRRKAFPGITKTHVKSDKSV
jgi:hypothetical protein